jgi:hypothetical protein
MFVVVLRRMTMFKTRLIKYYTPLSHSSMIVDGDVV